MSEYFLAIDIGASSGRHIIGWVDHGKMHLQEVHRFENRQVMADGHLCWDMDNLWRGVVEGLKACKEKNMVPATIGIDTWAVDFVLLDKDDRMIGNPVSYRDGRTTNIDKEVYKIIPEKELYEKTGIQRQPFNTIFQLMALKKESSKDLEEAKSLLMIPDYLNFLLTKVKKQEYTNASSTGLVNAITNSWDKELIDKLGLPQRLFGELSLPGTVVGKLSEDIAGEVGFSSTVILPATHDTGSAFLSVPARDETSVYLSSGTWSLLGIENESPIISEEARIENLTNEGGAFYRYRFLKNIMGLWIIQSVRRELNGSEYVKGKKSSYATGRNYSFPDLIEEAKKCEDFAGVIDVNDDSFLAPVSMIDAIKDYCKKKELPVPQSVGQIMQCVYKGLALCYRDTVRKLEDITGKRITGINIIGGGCQDEYLNSLTAKALGLPVYAGPIEGTAIGNLVIQMISAGIFALSFAATHKDKCIPLMDNGHYHPTEVVSDKIPALLSFFPNIALHITRPVRWDSDHVVLFDDETKEIAKEIVRCGGLEGSVFMALDYFDASINRISAWVTGYRNTQKALLYALLSPNEELKNLQDSGNFTELMVRMEELKTMPFGEVWNEYCQSCGVPGDGKWFEEAKRYEDEVLSKRS